MKILVFVSSGCPHCPDAMKVTKKVVPEYRSYGVAFEKIRVKTKEGKEITSKYNIMALPSILMIDDEQNEIKRITGAPKEDELKNEIEKNLGLKKSFFSKIFGR